MDGLFELSERRGRRATGAACFRAMSDGSTPLHSHGLEKVGGRVEGQLVYGLGTRSEPIPGKADRLASSARRRSC